MIEFKDRKRRYRNTGKKMKAASDTRSFLLDSKTYEKSKNWSKQIIQQARKKLKFFPKRVIKQGGRI